MGILPSLNIEVNRYTDRLEEEDLNQIEQWFKVHPGGVVTLSTAEAAPAPPSEPSVPQEQEPSPEPSVLDQKGPTPKGRQQAPVMPPPDAASRVFMPPVEVTPPAPLPPLAPPGRTPTQREPRREEAAPRDAGRQPGRRTPPVEARPQPAPAGAATRAPARGEARPAPSEGARERRPAREEARPERPADKRARPGKPGQRPEEGEAARERARREAREGRKPDPELTELSRRKVVTGQRGRPAGPPVVVETEGELEAGGRPRRRRGKRRKKAVASQEEIQRNVQRTLSEIGRGRVKRTYDRRGRVEVVAEAEGRNILRVTEYISVGELADLMDVKSSEVIATCLKLGLMVTVNQRLDMDTIQVIADEFGYDVQKLEAAEAITEPEEEEDRPEDLQPRPPVVTVMGHVDHGKTSLLDYIRSTNVIAGEAGGITQHIGAYVVKTDRGSITFLDTPGHQAFTAMRARGAQVTDVVVLVVAADDAVMPQTVEAINHARAAGVPIVVAINKIDLPTADPARIKRQLTEHSVIVEEYGGKVQAVQISAKRGDGVEDLLETLALETDLLELKANPNKPARGVVIEARLDKGRGPVATVLVQGGTLHVGDAFAAGLHAGRVRALLDERGNPLQEGGPSQPVQVLGFDDVPTAGDAFVVHADEREARELAQYRQQLRRQQDYSRTKKLSLTDLKRRITEGEIRRLPVIVKGDVDGSVEALGDELAKLSTSEVAIEVIHRGVGAISESDVLLASASNAIIVGFHVRPDVRARELAAQEQVEIRQYNVIYEAIEELRASLEGMLEAKVTEKVTGTAEVRQLFRVPKVGTIAGSMVRSGTITRGSHVRILRDGTEVYNGRIGTLRRLKDDVREVAMGYECGIWVENFNDVKVGDVIEAYDIVEEARTLDTVTG